MKIISRTLIVIAGLLAMGLAHSAYQEGRIKEATEMRERARKKIISDSIHRKGIGDYERMVRERDAENAKGPDILTLGDAILKAEKQQPSAPQ